MKISIYAPTPEGTELNPDAIAEILRYVPTGTEAVVLQAPPRRSVSLRACQRPGHLEYEASCDNKLFIFLSQPRPNGPYTVKVTT